MIRRFPCPWLGAEVELTAEVLADPEVIRRRGAAPPERLFSRWYTDLGRGRHVVVVVVTQAQNPPRHWIVTAYMARRLPRGGIEWRRG